MTGRVIPWDQIEGLDPLIAPYVRALQEAGIETVESCQSTEGHLGGNPDKYPWIRFVGGAGAGYKALGVALDRGWRVATLTREWRVLDCAITEVTWYLRLCPFRNPPSQ